MGSSLRSRKRLIARNGRRIVLPEGRQRHIAYFHPEVLVDEAKLAITLRDPELVAAGATEDTTVSYRFFADTPVTAKYLAVVVKLLNEEGFIVTAYFVDKVKRGRILWKRRSS